MCSGHRCAAIKFQVCRAIFKTEKKSLNPLYTILPKNEDASISIVTIQSSALRLWGATAWTKLYACKVFRGHKKIGNHCSPIEFKIKKKSTRVSPIATSSGLPWFEDLYWRWPVFQFKWRYFRRTKDETAGNESLCLNHLMRNVRQTWNILTLICFLGHFRATEDKDGSVIALSSTPDDNYLITADTSGRVSVWDIENYCLTDQEQVRAVLYCFLLDASEAMLPVCVVQAFKV